MTRPAIRLSPETDYSLRLPFWYAGGITAGLVILLPLALKRGWFGKSLGRWAVGLSLASLGFMQLRMGVREGANDTEI